MALFLTKGGVADPVQLLGSQPLKHLLGLPRATGFGSSTTAEATAAKWDGNGKVVIITGASAGLGLESARVLASRGAEVILAVRDPVKTQKAVAHIKASVPNAKLRVLEVELDSLASVKAFCDEFKRTGLPLHTIIANAGIMATPFGLSKDGYESQFAVNHLSHFLLVNTLLPIMIKTAEQCGEPGRIVNLTSFGHSFAPRREEDVAKILTKSALQSGEGYDEWGTGYGRSKLSNILFTRSLAEQLQGQPILAFAAHPGYIMGTDLSRHLVPSLKPVWLRSFFIRFLAPVLGRLMGGKTIAQGAATQVFLAVAPKEKVFSGEYYADVNVEPSSAVAHSKALAKQLWEVSKEAVAPFTSK